LIIECHPSKKIVEIPYVEPFVEKIDWDLQELRMNLPEGLLDLENLT
jgi:ribosomal 30S subunit maturation factor RimM